jgi:uncharacterized OsmC-like protein
MSDIVYRSHSRIERVKGPLRRAYLPSEAEPVHFSVHGAIAEHYFKGSIPDLEPHATTLDYIVASAAGWLVGTFGGALEARQIPAGEGLLSGDATGEVEKEEGVLVIRRIHVTLRLKTDQANREVADRVAGMFHDRCPVYRTLKPAIAMTTDLVFE